MKLIETDFNSINNFDLPFHNPFQRTNETEAHFIRRCDKSMAGLKQDYQLKFGGGTVYRNPGEKHVHSSSAKTGKKFCGNE